MCARSREGLISAEELNGSWIESWFSGISETYMDVRRYAHRPNPIFESSLQKDSPPLSLCSAVVVVYVAFLGP
jgi:hypothetical protein